MENSHLPIIHSLQFLTEVVNRRLHAHFYPGQPFELPPFPQLASGNPFVDFIQEKELSAEEFVLLLLALAPHIRPSLMETLVLQYLPQGGDFAEIGGAKGSSHRGMIPTGETALFVLAGNDIGKRLRLQQLLLEESLLIRENILSLEVVKEGEPLMSGRMLIAEEWLARFLTGREMPPRFSPDFPAKKISTAMTWDDLVLNAFTLSQIEDIQIWLEHNGRLLQDAVLQRKIKPGYKVLFYGPSGTGKTLTATLLGNQFGKDVYRIDLSQIVSKYIGETEKNLEKVFARATHKNWILFFDEADALFGKRTGVQNAHDRFANQEVSYLLQRMEDYPGLLILASNFKSNIDDAFLRRFHSIIHFPAPNAAERLRLWQKTLPAGFTPEPLINLQELAGKFELNGAAILNIVHYAALRSAARQDAFLRAADLMDGIRKEFRKEERSVNV